MPAKRPDREWVIRIAAVALAVGLAALPYFHPLNEELNFALVVVLVVIALEILFEIRFANRPPEDTTKKDVDLYLRGNHGFLNDILRSTYAKLEGTTKTTKDQFTFQHPSIAIDSYLDFFERLAEEQENRGEGRPLEVRAIHSTDPDLMLGLHPSSAELYKAQERFCRFGKLTRILCYKADPPDRETLQMAKKMLEVGVKVKYYSIRKNSIRHDFHWDFLFVKETGYGVIWDRLGVGMNSIGQATYICKPNYKESDLVDVWNQFNASSEEITLEQCKAALSNERTRTGDSPNLY